MIDYYHILGISWIDTTDTIRKNYYKRARYYHPDKFNGDPEKCETFKYLSEAYSTLSNPKKRYLYDISRLCNRVGVELDIDNVHMEDDDLHSLSTYYNRFRTSTECKFIYTLLRSLPTSPSGLLYHGASHDSVVRKPKTLDGRFIDEDYTVTLRRDIEDVYNTKCKEVLVLTKDKSERIFVTHSDYHITFKNGNSFLHIKICTHIVDPLISIRGDDILLETSIDLFQYFFESHITTDFLSKRYHVSPQKNTPELYIGGGLHNPCSNKRGNLYICPKILYHMNYRVAKNHMNLIKTLLKHR